MAEGVMRVVGLMSGTSLDGIDAAYVETDGIDHVRPGPAVTLPYPPAFRARLKSVLGGAGDAATVAAVEAELTERHAEAVAALGVDRLDLIGFHGHTILHRPEEHRTWQIGDGRRLAALTGVPVASDFRSADVAAGGEGAPLVPVYHRALTAGLDRPLAVLNIGGVANVTWIGAGEDEILAFDTGPGNAPIDDWAQRHTHEPIDRDGALAAAGQVDQDFLARFLADPFFSRKAPKSLDRDHFAAWTPDHLGAADGAATLTACTAAAIGRAAQHFPTPVRRWLVTGGGRRNPVLMAELARILAAPVEPVDGLGWDGDALEAQAFAYLAVRSTKGLPLSFPGTTGVGAPQIGGRLSPAPVSFAEVSP
jgi:anhydro-N-acetylmuramic acid kinase